MIARTLLTVSWNMIMSTLYAQYIGGENPEKTTDLFQVTDKLYLVMLYRAHVSTGRFELTTLINFVTNNVNKTWVLIWKTGGTEQKNECTFGGRPVLYRLTTRSNYPSLQSEKHSYWIWDERYNLWKVKYVNYDSLLTDN